MKIWIYESRSAPSAAYYNFSDARKQQDEDNRMTVEEILEDQGEWAVEGSEEEGFFSIDDGGSIDLVEVQ